MHADDAQVHFYTAVHERSLGLGAKFVPHIQPVASEADRRLSGALRKQAEHASTGRNPGDRSDDEGVLEDPTESRTKSVGKRCVVICPR